MKYFYTDNGETAVGPLSREALLTLKGGGVIADSTRVKEEGATDWKSFAAVFETEKQAASPSSSENANGISDSSNPQLKIYKNLADIAEGATLKLLLLFSETDAAPDNDGIEKLLLKFLLGADDFTETCCQQYAVTLRKASMLAEVRGTPTTILVRQIRENCFSKTDGILTSYLEALKSCQIDLQNAADKFEESSVLGAALRGGALGQLAGGFGKTGARLGIVNAAISGFAERDKQRELLWEQSKAKEDAKRAAGRKIIEYLIAVKSVPRSLLDFGCARAFGGQVDFELQGAALSAVEAAIGEKISGSIARAVEISGVQVDSRQLEDEIATAPANGIEQGAIDAVTQLLGGEGKSALIYAFKCQIGLKSNLQLFAAVTNNRVWIGGIKIGGSEAVQVLDLPFSRLQFIYQQSKNTIFSGAVSKITLKWGGLFDVAILNSSKEQGEFFFKVLKRRVARENKACVFG